MPCKPSLMMSKQIWIKKYLPKSLMARSLLIIMLPIIIMQMIVAWIFFDAHWQTVTRSLSENVAADIALAVELYQQDPGQNQLDKLNALIRDDLKLSVAYDAKDVLPATTRRAFFTALDKTLGRALSQSLDYKFWFDTTRYPNYVDIRVLVEDKVLKFIVPRERVFAPTGFIFLFWLLTATAILSLVSILFIKNQVRPIAELANAAENFGKGRPIGKFKPSGAREVRQAGHAFLEMRRRIGRHLEQRTTLLAGVSHDLRTPLTRLKLFLAMEDQNEEAKKAKADLDDMQKMLDGYLDFAKDTTSEQMQMADLTQLLIKACEKITPKPKTNIAADLKLNIRPMAIRRAVSNLLLNASHYGKNPKISAKKSGSNIEIIIDDDGEGISPANRKEALKPFVRLDSARNQNINGVGLGLSIANDIIQAHGGRLDLLTSPTGGLRCKILLPV